MMPGSLASFVYGVPVGSCYKCFSLYIFLHLVLSSPSRASSPEGRELLMQRGQKKGAGSQPPAPSLISPPAESKWLFPPLCPHLIPKIHVCKHPRQCFSKFLPGQTRPICHISQPITSAFILSRREICWLEQLQCSNAHERPLCCSGATSGSIGCF